MTREVRWERMFPDALEATFARCPVVFFTYGLCEPHGPQNALGLDGLKAHAVACKTAQDGGIVAPPYYWHIFEQGLAASWAHEQIGQVERTWLSSIPLWQFYKNALYHLRTADVLRFHAAIVLWGHDGGTDDLRTFLELVQPHVGARLYGCGDWEANTPGFDGTTGDHAGKVETSLLWALQPDCVDVSRFPREQTKPAPSGRWATTHAKQTGALANGWLQTRFVGSVRKPRNCSRTTSAPSRAMP